MDNAQVDSSENQGASWNEAGLGVSGQFSVTATSLPEPTGLPLVVAVLLILTCRRRGRVVAGD
jgi:hypothetical protein